MNAKIATLAVTFCVLLYLIWPRVSYADALQFKCSGTNADIRYAKVWLNGAIYFTDKFGKIGVPNVSELTGKKIVVYSTAGEGKIVEVPRDGQIFAPCR
jgi:hypothetical protein